jgi:spermidine synthase
MNRLMNRLMNRPMNQTTGRPSIHQSLFIAAILASSFLIFLVQPMVGKRILPWFGGTPSVWTLCFAFYQTTLFLGYAYAHLLIRFASPFAQIAIHSAVISGALLVLPVLPNESWQSGDVANPSIEILAMLGTSVALPFMALASTGPLVQAWFARVYPNRSPYPLYAVSNVGSFAALLAYPFLFEPRLSLSATGDVWSLAFAATVIAVVACAVVARNADTATTPHADTISSQPAAEPTAGSAAHEPIDRPDVQHVSLWILLSGSAVVLLMGVTNSVCLDIASVPFLWILPLATYLFTFILCFASERNYRPIPFVLLALVTSFVTVGFHFTNDVAAGVLSDELARSLFDRLHSVYVQVPAYCALLFAGSMIMHGELYRLRPAPKSLTLFYLCVSGGGALGGLFVGLLAPTLFDGYFEIRVGLALTLLLFLAASALRASASNPKLTGWPWRLAAPLAIVLGLYSVVPPSPNRELIIHDERSFFGVLQVIEIRHDNILERHLMSGTTLHGVEFINERGRPLPTSYFGRATGIATTFSHLFSRLPPNQGARVGVIGLGIGTLSAYGRPGDSFRYYEIDPAVAHIAGETGYFSFLEKSMAEVVVVIGDARLEIEREQESGPAQAYDLLVLDAFNSDAIPVHLLTAEAFRLYTRSLAKDGLLAVHISNRHFDLLPLVARAGSEVGLAAVDLRTAAAPGFQSLPAHWMVLSANRQHLESVAETLRERTELMNLPATHAKIAFPQQEDLLGVALWTDDYSDLFSALK